MTLMLGDPLGANRGSVKAMLRNICPKADLRISTEGVVTIEYGDFCTHKHETSLSHGCVCQCTLIESEKIVIIVVREDLGKSGGGRTDPSAADSGSNGEGCDSVVNIENGNRYRQRRRDSGEWMDVPDWVMLAHELCGHALPLALGNHPEWRPGRPGYKPNWHSQSQKAEDEIRTNHGLPPHGTNHGVKPK